MKTQYSLKQALLEKIATVASEQKLTPGTPLTDLNLNQDTRLALENFTIAVEKQTPYPQPLKDVPEMLNGPWQLLYSNAREIRNLSSLPLGFELGKVYQKIDVASKSFLNQAYCQHSLKLLAGYVVVTATFYSAPTAADGQPFRKINVNFQKRSLVVQKILGVKLPRQQVVKEVRANNPVGRIPSLTITYLDDSLRIGRGGDGSLFILKKAEEVVA
ncbi:PAP/fibrillin family protein [Spirulina sp. CS-785/01]|uniref:PAP/fibrillin family protein n=1 Tax=Spirulina sp. CS-785/01 TaxID=3021716 RepID=UPI00232CF743|nr:PAP/fibrillin family protein [Spirulina sp. CS-785/01]MDB9314728.1 PAP/fibrillin family protein [Spirulina sp. CS-785/01]